MAQKKEYRSAIRSRKRIREALISLLKEKDISKITVKDIADRADLNRATFYAHYPDVRGVIEEIENEIISRLKDILVGVRFEKTYQNPAPLLLKINRYLEEDLDFYRTLILANGADRFLEKLKDVYINYLNADTDIPEVIRDTAALQIQLKFFADGIIGIYKRWFQGEVPGSLDDITVQVSQIISASVQTLLTDP